MMRNARLLASTHCALLCFMAAVVRRRPLSCSTIYTLLLNLTETILIPMTMDSLLRLLFEVGPSLLAMWTTFHTPPPWLWMDFTNSLTALMLVFKLRPLPALHSFLRRRATMRKRQENPGIFPSTQRSSQVACQSSRSRAPNQSQRRIAETFEIA